MRIKILNNPQFKMQFPPQYLNLQRCKSINIMNVLFYEIIESCCSSPKKLCVIARYKINIFFILY